MSQWPAEERFMRALYSLLKGTAPPTQQKIMSIAKMAVEQHKYYKFVVKAVEKFVRKCQSAPQHLLGACYVIDAICRRSQSKFGTKDRYGPRFYNNLRETQRILLQAPAADRDKLERVFRMWESNKVIQPDGVAGSASSSSGVGASSSSSSRSNRSSKKSHGGKRGRKRSPHTPPGTPPPHSRISNHALGIGLGAGGGSSNGNNSSGGGLGMGAPGIPQSLPAIDLAPAPVKNLFVLPGEGQSSAPGMQAAVPPVAAAPSVEVPLDVGVLDDFDYGDDDDVVPTELKRRRLEEEREVNNASGASASSAANSSGLGASGGRSGGSGLLSEEAKQQLLATILELQNQGKANEIPMVLQSVGVTEEMLAELIQAAASSSSVTMIGGVPHEEVKADTLYVSNLPRTVVQEELEAIFRNFGMQHINMGVGHAYVVFRDHESAAQAMVQLKGFPVHNHQINIGWVEPNGHPVNFDSATGIGYLPVGASTERRRGEHSSSSSSYSGRGRSPSSRGARDYGGRDSRYRSSSSNSSYRRDGGGGGGRRY